MCAVEMKREFVIEEIMLPGLSGDIRGWIEIDSDTGSVDHVECTVFDFRRDGSDQEACLAEDQRRVVVQIAEQTMAEQRDLWTHRSTIIVSAEAYSPTSHMSPSNRVLTEYLAAPRKTDVAANSSQSQPPRRRAQ